MDKKTQEKAMQALERQKKQYARQNAYINDNYERQTVTLPKGTKEKIKARGETVNGFINKLVAEALREN